MEKEKCDSCGVLLDPDELFAISGGDDICTKCYDIVWRTMEDSELEKKYGVLKLFKYAHLPEALQEFSKPIGDMARDFAIRLNNSAHPAEVATGLRKLLEAKDCFVRARLPPDGMPIPRDQKKE